jgi:3',5'-cyclic AMP phosphodiesterase CpdA
MLTILQGSDVHFGRLYDPRAGEYFAEATNRIDPDILVLAGDFSQRAKPAEYAAARAFMDRVGGRPLVVTPGNHDVALYRVWERLAYPFRNYRRYISRDLDTFLRVRGACFVSLNSAAPRRAIVNGRLDDGQMEFAAQVFQEEPNDGLRVVVTHHSLTAPPDGGKEAHLPRSQEWLDAFGGLGVEMVLSGHLHRAFVVRTSGGATASRSGGIVLTHSGTATSSRGRRGERGCNSFNVIEVDRDSIVVTRHLREAGGGGFDPTWRESFRRESGSGAGNREENDGEGE